MERSIIDLLINKCGIHRLVNDSMNYAEYKELTALKQKVYDKLFETLSKEQKGLMKKYEDLESDAHVIYEEAYFRLGVKTGVRLTAECMFD